MRESFVNALELILMSEYHDVKEGFIKFGLMKHNIIGESLGHSQIRAQANC